MAPFMTHLALHVRDLAACIDFYREYCGMDVIHERGDQDDGTRIVWLAEPGRQQEFIFVKPVKICIINGPAVIVGDDGILSPADVQCRTAASER